MLVCKFDRLEARSVSGSRISGQGAFKMFQQPMAISAVPKCRVRGITGQA